MSPEFGNYHGKCNIQRRNLREKKKSMLQDETNHYIMANKNFQR